VSTTVDQHFVEQFEAEVHLSYQRFGSMLRNTVRRKDGIVGSQTNFRKSGKGTAGTKSRHGQVPLANLVHTNVVCALADYYLGEFLDELDELKTNIDEREIATVSLAAAMGRKSDELIRDDGLTQATNQTATAGGVTKAKLEIIYESFGNKDVPADGQRYIGVSAQGFTDLMNLAEFSTAEFMGSGELPWRNPVGAKRFMSFIVFEYSGWSMPAAIRTSMAWHRTAVGHGSGKEIGLDLTWQGKEQAHLAVTSMSQGSCTIDTDGLYELRHTEV